jgi:hypothetical protein
MSGGQPHDLIPTVEQQRASRAMTDRRRACGAGDQVPTTAPDRRIRFLPQLEQLVEPDSSTDAAARPALLEPFARWHAWQASRELDRMGG